MGSMSAMEPTTVQLQVYPSRGSDALSGSYETAAASRSRVPPADALCHSPPAMCTASGEGVTSTRSTVSAPAIIAWLPEPPVDALRTTLYDTPPVSRPGGRMSCRPVSAAASSSISACAGSYAPSARTIDHRKSIGMLASFVLKLGHPVAAPQEGFGRST